MRKISKAKAALPLKMFVMLFSKNESFILRENNEHNQSCSVYNLWIQISSLACVHLKVF